MARTPTPQEVFDQLVGGVCALVGGDVGQVDALAALYAEQTNVQHPMAPLGDTALLTREQLRRHFAAAAAGGAARLTDFRATDISVHHSTDPEVIVAEFRYQGNSPAGPFSVPCVFILRVRDGLIVSSRDYVNHLEFARIGGRLDDLFAALAAA